MEHIEQAGVHSGDSACAIPPPTLSGRGHCNRSRSTRARSPTRCRSSGSLNVQYAVKDGKVFVIEANPRASRTVPFVSKATGVPLAKVAARRDARRDLRRAARRRVWCTRRPKAATSR